MFIWTFMLQTSETALAKFPELPQAKSVVNSTTSWMSVSFADEPPSEIQPAQTYRSTWEIHTHQQAWLQLVRTQTNMKTHKIKFTFFLSLPLFPFPIFLPLHWELVMSEQLITELWLFSPMNSLFLLLVFTHSLTHSRTHSLTLSHTHTHTHTHTGTSPHINERF